jgi:hypothetical protein
MIVAADMRPILNLWAFGQDLRICWVQVGREVIMLPPSFSQLFKTRNQASRDARPRGLFSRWFKVERFSET